MACVNCVGESKSIKQDSLWSWIVCVSASICVALTTGFAFALGVILPVLMDALHENRERTAWVSSIAVGLFCFLGPVMGAFVNRFRCRISIILGCLTSAVALVLGSFAPSLLVLLFAFSVPFAVGTSVIYVAAPIGVTHYFTRQRSVALGFVTAGQGVGVMVVGPVLRVLTDATDWREAFCVFSGVLAFVSFSGCLFKSPSSDKLQNHPSKKFTFNFSLWKNRFYVIMVLMAGLQTFSRMVPYVHLARHCDDLKIPGTTSSSLFLFIGVFAACGRIGGGIMCDLPRINSRCLYQSAVFVMGASTALLTVAKTYESLVACAITFGTADGIMVSTHMIQTLKIVGETERASALGFAMMMAGIMSLASPPLSGLMADKHGNYVAAFLVAGGLAIVSSLIPFLLLCSRNSKQEDIDIEEIMDKGQNEDSGSTREEALLAQKEQDELAELHGSGLDKAARRKGNGTHRRPVSFMIAMESPFY